MDASSRKYSADELLQYAYKYNQIPVILFAKDKEGIYTHQRWRASLMEVKNTPFWEKQIWIYNMIVH